MMTRVTMCIVRGMLLGAAAGTAIGIVAGRSKAGKWCCFKKKAGKALHSMGSVVDAVSYLMK